MPHFRFRIEQASTWLPSGLWDWSMQVVPVDASVSLDEVCFVTYGLHPVFPNPNRVIRNKAGGFALRMFARVSQNETWGRFDVRVTLALRDGTREIHNEPLNLTKPDSTPAPELLSLPANADFELSKIYYGYLKRKGAYGYARQVLGRAAELLRDDAVKKGGDPEYIREQLLWVAQQRAFCTYKDPSLPTDTRLRDALAILQNDADGCRLNLTDCDDPETLGLGGAVYKRLWDVTRSRADLELAHAYYRRGYEVMLRSPRHRLYDAGAFTGVNVAHVGELLSLETPPEVDPQARKMRLAEADQVRRQLVRDLPALQSASAVDGIPVWWIAATLLDVYFSLACHDPTYEAKLLEQAALAGRVAASPWEFQTTGTQLLRSAKLQKRLGRGPAAEIDSLLARSIQLAFQDNVVVSEHEGVEGKAGLALSGGGFRASLFHIGVLARMAELDLLRCVEVISCVSGGSIVGAHYYLLLRKLLQEKADGAIERNDYIVLVEELLAQFLDGVQKNIRMHVAASWLANLRMLFQPSHYSRTQRLGRLYEKYLYSRVQDDEGSSPRWLNEAFIVPRGKGGAYEDAFSPKVDNWRRGAKVPMLVLNATTLNTGRNWQFTASFMGEPVSYGTTVDATERLDAVYFNEAPDAWKRYRLGDAVAASSCVPALFTPIVLPNLFKGRTVRLVDGGVHDNQGIRALFDQDCDLVFVSDASGQMESLVNPPHGEIGVALRTNSVLQARVRVAQHQELQARERVGQLRQGVFLHLRKNLEGTVQSAATQAPSVAGVDMGAIPGDVTEYGIERRIQRALASLRTDLDSFTDREALSLMYSGYKMAEKYFPTPAGAPPPSSKWEFLRVAEASAGRDQQDLTVKSLLRHLTAGSQLAFKVWHLNPVLNAIRIAFLAAVGLGALCGLIYLVHEHVRIPLDGQRIDLGGIAKSILIMLVPIGIGMLFPFAKAWLAGVKAALNPGSVVAHIAFGIVMATVGWFVCRLHLWVFDRFFLFLGRVRR
ncbi:MAG: patatin-like phospholipase family protein [Gammaproteobacteria bacterium]